MTTRVIHIKDAPPKPWPAEYVYVGRPGPWGNPYRLTGEGTRQRCIWLFENMLAKDRKWVDNIRATLKDKILVCYCEPLPCHGHILAKVADGGEPDLHIFVFGSNLAGKHGAGSAREAVQFWGAKYGQPRGAQGCAYAIPTKDHGLEPLPLSQIKVEVDRFLQDASINSSVLFHTVKIGCGLAGYKEEQIKPFFANATANVILPPGWRAQ